ncbi:pyridoxamine 5'-phosphate oxidase family protein [Nocardia tengchongensis]|uniref:Pyridoxamine 5'-phosphate oxidase family protein n=1 Tax=Nocardia tengchongensis TaxID=2055889 RepID=A0ABX8CK55_9NOCA|nr:pyridoxamine 5'-phosphate oxidase family protein [Nocardia tengchongensis]QVI18915.1 pyridoxamine 5'-phosphate oxidase family protein [Nocardia tengchongensis]
MGGVGARRLRELSAADSLKRLAGAQYGRIVYSRRGLPIIRPVNHIVEEDVVVVRAHLGASLLRGDGQVVAYEADSFDEHTRQGWSVIVTGVARVVMDPEQVQRYETLLDPWINMPMDHVIRIEAEVVTGLELIDESDWTEPPRRTPR